MGRKRHKQRSYRMSDADIAQHYPLVYSIANRLYPFYRYHLSQEEAEQAGMLGLVLAARYFRPSLGNQFSTYAYLAIRSQIVNAVRNDYPIHVPQTAYNSEEGRLASAKLKMTHLPENDEELGGKETPWQDAVIHKIDVANLLRWLNQRDRRILRLAVGIDGPARSELEIAQLEHTSKNRAHQLKKRAYAKLRKFCRMDNYL